MICPNCGKPNVEQAKFCAECGRELLLEVKVESSSQNSSDPQEFYKAYLGPKNQGYYLRHFARFDRDGKTGASWHWPAFFVTFFWLLYRKMWLYALLYFLLPYIFVIFVAIIAGVAGVAGDSADGILRLGNLLFLVFLLLFPPLYANAFYYKQCKKKISETRASTQNLQRQLGELSGKGGTSNVAMIIAFIFGFFAIVGILAAIAIPAYVSYTAKARVISAVSIGKTATASVTEYYYQNQALPLTLEQAGFEAQLPPSLKGLDFDNENGIVVITMAEGPLNDQTLLFVPGLDSDNQIYWTCVSQDIQENYLPPECRLEE